MPSVTNTSNLKSLTIEEVIEGVFANADSADEAITPEPETSEVDDESGAPPTKTHQDNAHKRGRKRGRSERNII